MLRLLFILPILLCLLWWLFLHYNRIPLKQGRKGFVYIVAFSTLVLGFFTLMLFVTNTPLE
ncbi:MULTISPECIES: hypothetical protein [Pseudoalteromonas]|uniref:Uncharacterized protein n=1 Tax=Pseudoalteromonas ruthenica TaxID=151081 RepID=A0A5S3Z4V8_9GAMM|nr:MULTISPECIES: hypothetical protein [Pseudoalteromonas]MCF2862412.1 hypothetical protein [Pseudoalteromonas sp. CNAT2-18]MCG7545092.1 hypothetical protein [Pseudoalteromonas sp. MM17-2]MCG7557819.1 hypothetical protein [Pseudoalteromonas sp. CNAT2-18.1]MCG7566192.1 hypothetical protein [Pseudoalteromonas sp. CnMc7-15]TLX49784.1 hypothetical protein CWC31_15055 [Pseudoalteromonas ruthenica]